MNESRHNIIQVLLEAAEKAGNKTALMHQGKTWSYTELIGQVQSAAGTFQKKGIRKNDRVLVFVPMGLELYRTVLALFYIGAVPVFIDEWVSRERFRLCCSMVPCQALIAGRKILVASLLIKELRKIKIRITAAAKDRYRITSAEKVGGSDTALITFTTGNTGLPKAAGRSHDLLRAQLNALAPLIGQTSGPSFCSLPVVVLLNLALGRTSLLPHQKFKIRDPSSIKWLARDIQAVKAGVVMASPAVVLRLADELEAADRSGIRQLITGGGPVLRGEAKKISERFPLAEKIIVFGSTEAEPISQIEATDLANCTIDDIMNKGLPVGLPHKQARVAIIPFLDSPVEPLTEQDWENFRLNYGCAGEIVVTGPHVLKSYLNDPEAERRNKIRVGTEVWHRTGDAGRLDENGRLYFLGRCGERIEVNRRTIFPLVAGSVVEALTGRTATIVEKSGRLVLVIEGRSPVDRNSVETALRQLELGDVAVRYLDPIPRDARHQTKIDYLRLKALI